MNWFSRSSAKPTSPWEEITTESRLKELFSQSATFAIFKHSTRCSISHMAMNRLVSGLTGREDIPVYLVDVIAHRDISNSVEKLTGIRHESPQLIVIRNGKALVSGSHNAISAHMFDKAV